MSRPSLTLDDLENSVEFTLPADRFRLRRALRSIARNYAAGHDVERQMEHVAQQIEDSLALREKRRAGVPAIHWDAQLPITAHRNEIAAAIEQHPVTIVCGDTGSGKSTQLPKICLAAGRGIEGIIGHTQPRRLAARAVAARLADELRVLLGQQVGYKIRFTDRTRPESFIKVMTDGILLAETQSDRFFDQYDTLIIDEAHERSLNIDFLVGYIKRLLPRRPDLRVIITSATLEAARFQSHFNWAQGPAPVIEVGGRSYPVEVRYRPLATTGEDGDNEQLRGIRAGLAELCQQGPGDVLVFLPTERDIRETAQYLRGWLAAERIEPGLEILPLYARLSTAEQQRIFADHPHRRVVLATNVAESSLTVPGVRYVLDTGTVRMKRYSPRAQVQRLPIEPISQASAEQRKGRCGRVGPGICIRLYSEEDLASREPYTTPEIRRTNLAAVILQTKALKLGAVEEFPFLDPPRPDSLRDGYHTLFELGAIDEHRQLTSIGRMLSRLPVDPRIGRMIVAADQENCLHEVLIIAAALELQDPRERPVDRQQAADEAHARYADEQSDFLSYLKLWDYFHQLKDELSRNQLQKACSRQYLSLGRLRDWGEAFRQLKRLVEEQGFRVRPRRDDRAAIHRALLPGLLSGIAYRSEGYEYTGAGGNKLYLWPGSAVFAKRPKWIVAAEMIETSRRYARTVAQIDPAWIEPLAAHLVEKRHVAPFWSRKRGAPMVYEKVSLYGMPVVTRRPVPWGPIDGDAARRMFIREALVRGNCALNFRFLNENGKVLHEALTQAAKLRLSDWAVAESAQIQFYEDRLPKHIYDVARLRHWLPQAERQNPLVLRMRLDDLLPPGRAEIPKQEYPDALELPDLRLPLDYHFEPGSSQDGITVTLPQSLLAELAPEPFEWLVPGRLEEKIAALIRTLPKPVRRCLVPAPDTAKAVASELTFGEGPFLKRLAKRLELRAGMPIAPDDLKVEELPPHLRMHFKVVDEHGQTLGTSRDLAALIDKFATTAAPQTPAASAWQRPGLTTWDFDELPEMVEFDLGGVIVRRYPTLVDEGESVALQLVDWPASAADQLHRGVRRLLVLSEMRELRAQVAWLPHRDEIRRNAEALPGGTDIDSAAIDLLADRAFLSDGTLPRSRAAFEHLRATGRQRIGLAVQEIAGLLHTLLSSHAEAVQRRTLDASPLWQPALDDIDEQLAMLVYPGFLTGTSFEWLQQYPRYFQAIVYRLERLRSGSLARDRAGLEQLAPYVELYRTTLAEHRDLHIHDPELANYRWMLEEFRVSLFAQPLGTHVPVSAKRLDKQYGKVRH